MRPYRIVLADDHTLVLEAFKNLLSSDVDVVGTAADGRELIRVVREMKPDVVVSDISMPHLNGLDACIKLLKLVPGVKIIFLTVSNDPEIVADVIRAGAKGYLLKSSAVSELLQAIKAVAVGGTYITPLVANGMVGSVNSSERRELSEKLTVRQREILHLLAEGNTMKQVSRILYITPSTVSFHKYRIMQKLGVENNAELLRLAVKSGLFES